MSNSTLVSKIMPHVVAGIIFLLVPVMYFIPQTQGKVLEAHDIVSSHAYGEEINNLRKTTGERSWWTNSIFGGMPAYQIEAGQPSNQLKHLEKVNQLGISRPIGYFFGMCVSFYAMLIFLGVNPWLGIIGALAFSFSTGNMLLLSAGHMSKLRVFAFFGLIAMGMFMCFRNNYVKGAIVFAAGLGLNLYGNHIQMTYFFFIVLAIYGIIEFINAMKKGQLAQFGKAVLFLVIATAIGVASSASKLWSTYEYSKDTMRGDPILVSQSDTPKSSSETKGLQWDYAMQWSNGFLDLFAGIIPRVVGGSAGESLGKDSALYKDLRKKGANLGNDFRAPMYWGSLNSTGGPFYFGAIFCFLFILGLILIKGPMKWWLGISAVILMLMSMGKNFAILNQLLFDYFPLYNKFRTPNSIVSVLGFVVPILGMVVLSDIIKGNIDKSRAILGLKIAFGITGGLTLFFALVGPSVFNVSHIGDARLEQAGYSLEAIFLDRKALLRSDSLRSFVLIALSAGLIWAFIKEKIKANVLMIAIGILSIGDLWQIDKKYMNESNFVPKSKAEANIKPRPADLQILKDNDLSYRVLDMSRDPWNDAFGAFFHKMIGGYHAAKLQRYADLIDRHLSKGNQSVLRMLNTKYVINQQQQVQTFPDPAGNAWFVNSVKKVNTPLEEIDGLNNFDPKQQAIIHNEFEGYLAGLNTTGNGSINLISYKPNHLVYQSNTSSDELAVFSEIWYGPDKGWNAYIDGEKVDHIRANYALRALKIPLGQHEIDFKFEPETFRKGELISLITSLLILLLFLGLIGKEFFENSRRWSSEKYVASKIATAKPVAKTTSTKKKKKR